MKDCGVDLATDAPYEAVAKLFRETVDELKQLCD